MQGEAVRGQAGFFSEWADGANIDRLPLEARAAWLQRLPAEWVRTAPRCSTPPQVRVVEAALGPARHCELCRVWPGSAATAQP